MRPAWIRYIFSLLCLVLSSPGLNAQTSLVLCAATDRGELVSSIARTGVHQQKALDSLINLPERWCFTLREKGNPGSSDHHLEIAGPVTHGKATYRGIDLSVRWWPDRILIREASRPYAPGVTLQREQTDPVGYAHSPHPGFRLTQPEALLVTLAFQPAQMAEDIRVIDHWMDHTDSLPEILREFSSVSTYPEDPVERLLMLNRCEAATRLAQDILNYLNAFALAGDTAAPLAQARAILQETARINELGRSTKLPLAEGYYRTAVKHLTRGDTASAMEALHRSVAADPMHCGALEALAGTALKRQQPVIALNAARSLSLANPSDARPALRRLLPDFVATFDRLFVAEDHPSLLEMADSLIQYYIHAGEDTVVLTSQRERSRAATVEAYQRVADKARAEGRRPLAARYQAMAEEHRRQWGLPVPAAHSARSREERGISEPPPSEAVLARDTALAMPAEIRTTGEDNLRNTHVEGEESKNSGQELLYARGLPTSAHGLQIQDAQDTNKLILLDAKLLQYVNDWISDRGVGARFR
ncbi:MAG TPA: hypothetical protein P5248_06790, partial [Bacteroidales bacterium]|nr:hypothetical protein [Bacteroidales bacterium]